MLASPTLLLLIVPALAASIPVLFWQPGGWPEIAGRLGVIGVGLSAWVDVADNCAVIGCVERDPALLSGMWALSIALAAVGALAIGVRMAVRRASQHDA